MHEWISRQYREHKWLTIAVGTYLTLSAVELTRVLLFDRPTVDDAGFYAWEKAAAPGVSEAAISFRWTGAAGAVLQPVDGAVFTLLLYAAHPNLPENGIPVALTINDRQLDALTIRRNGWHSLEYYVPPILAADVWKQVKPGWAARTNAEIVADEGGWFAAWQELKPWHRRPGPPPIWIEVAVGSTFVPSELLDTDDDRTLGIGVGEVRWLERPPASGLGFHDWETDLEGTRFRWTSQMWASQPVEVHGRVGDLQLRADNPDLASAPVIVALYWNERLLRTVEIGDHDWTTVSLNTDELSRNSGVLSFHVERTWSPANSGVSADTRRLGVAVSEIEWH